jgi:hypothetical protein
VLLACIRIWIKFVRTIISLQLFIIGIQRITSASCGVQAFRSGPQ